MNQTPRASESANDAPARCYRCFRPRSLCYCEAIPRVDNRTHVLILQHVGERFHPFNTARIVQQALRKCHMTVDHNQRLGTRQLPIEQGACLLYPRADAPELTELPAGERPSQLVVVDGTWRQAATIVRDVPQLSGLPCYRLAPAAAGQYRIRRERDAQSLSTLEAVVAALRVLEPDTVGLDQMLSVFRQMVESHCDRRADQSNKRWKRRGPARLRHLPQALLKNPGDMVVAYGEATPGQNRALSTPVNWVAQRLGDRERFSCCLQVQQPLSEDVLHHMRLSQEELDDAVSDAEFRRRWNQFLRREDVLIVYHARTSQLLRNMKVSPSRCLALKSIFRMQRTDFHSLEELIAVEGIKLSACKNESRANQRLRGAVALVEHLVNQLGERQEAGEE